jgi:uncharacterized protein (UPF0335 family)
MGKKLPADIHEALKMVHAAGFDVRPRHKYIKKTFEFEEVTLKAFIELVEQLGTKQKTAINEALSDWIRSKGATET